MDRIRVITTEIKAAANSTFAIGGIECSEEIFAVAESSVLRLVLLLL